MPFQAPNPQDSQVQVERTPEVRPAEVFDTPSAFGDRGVGKISPAEVEQVLRQQSNQKQEEGDFLDAIDNAQTNKNELELPKGKLFSVSSEVRADFMKKMIDGYSNLPKERQDEVAQKIFETSHKFVFSNAYFTEENYAKLQQLEPGSNEFVRFVSKNASYFEPLSKDDAYNVRVAYGRGEKGLSSLDRLDHIDNELKTVFGHENLQFQEMQIASRGFDSPDQYAEVLANLMVGSGSVVWHGSTYIDKKAVFARFFETASPEIAQQLPALLRKHTGTEGADLFKGTNNNLPAILDNYIKVAAQEASNKKMGENYFGTYVGGAIGLNASASFYDLIGSRILPNKTGVGGQALKTGGMGLTTIIGAGAGNWVSQKMNEGKEKDPLSMSMADFESSVSKTLSKIHPEYLTSLNKVNSILDDRSTSSSEKVNGVLAISNETTGGFSALARRYYAATNGNKIEDRIIDKLELKDSKEFFNKAFGDNLQFSNFQAQILKENNFAGIRQVFKETNPSAIYALSSVFRKEVGQSIDDVLLSEKSKLSKFELSDLTLLASSEAGRKLEGLAKNSQGPKDFLKSFRQYDQVFASTNDLGSSFSLVAHAALAYDEKGSGASFLNDVVPLLNERELATVGLYYDSVGSQSREAVGVQLKKNLDSISGNQEIIDKAKNTPSFMKTLEVYVGSRNSNDLFNESQLEAYSNLLK